MDTLKSERQTKNLGRILQKSDLAPVSLPTGNYKCNKSRCGTCAHMTECNNITFNTDTGITNFKLLKHFSCYSTHVIYKISCTGCGEYYIGQTCYLRNRVTKHKCDIRNDAYRIMKVHTHVHDCTKTCLLLSLLFHFFRLSRKL